MLFGTNINLNCNELQNAVLQNLLGQPATLKAGAVWFDTTSGVAAVKYYNGSEIITLGGGSKINLSSDGELGVLANQHEYRCDVRPTMTIPAISGAGAEYACVVVYQSTGTTAPGITNNSGYPLKYSGQNVLNGAFVPMPGTVYRLSIVFDGFNLNVYVSGVS